MIIEEIREDERPRERAIEYGIDALSNRELLALILRSGYKGVSVLQMADDLLNRYGLKGLSSLTYADLRKEKGIKEAKALELLACFELSRRCLREEVKSKKVIGNRKQLTEWLRSEIGSLNREHLICIFLNADNTMISYKLIYRGTSETVPFSPKDIFREAIMCNARKVLIAHNHPQGNPYPSKQDILSTELMLDAGKMVEIPLVDHLIITRDGFTSIFAYMKLIGRDNGKYQDLIVFE